MLPKAEELAYGRWPDILSAAGVASEYFTKRAGPCPFCGGTDRYVWQEKSGGRYLCRHCTEATYKNGFDFLMRHMAYREFRQAADHVREFFGLCPDTERQEVNRVVDRLAREAPCRQTQEVDVAKAIARMERVFNEGYPVVAGDPVDRYLRARVPGLGRIPSEIRCHPALPYWALSSGPSGVPELLGNFPAMLVRGFAPNGDLVQLHKTYLTRDGKKAPVADPKKTDRGIGANSFALRLGQPDGDALGVSEGIESGLAASVMYDGMPVWPCHSSSILANFSVPDDLRDQVRKVIIFADSDERKRGRRAGQEAAATLAARLRKEGVRSMIVRPAKTGTDFADLAA
jgi:putative DNA primase/helicase